MPVESPVTGIADLNPLWPLGTDPKSEGDDHLRLIKSALKSLTGGAIVRMTQTIRTSSGTWTKPTGLKMLRVSVQGSGGGSGGTAATAAGTSCAGGGGGGGSWSTITYLASALSASIPFTVGAQGAAGAAGGNGGVGGTSAFVGLTCPGGTGGQAIAAGATLAAANRGVGGSSVTGDYAIDGGPGGLGIRAWMGVATSAFAGDGGGSMLAPFRTGYTSSGAAGAAGANYGGGAIGAVAGQSQAAFAGALGGAAMILFEEYF